jgi:hypothetical protein
MANEHQPRTAGLAVMLVHAHIVHAFGWTLGSEMSARTGSCALAIFAEVGSATDPTRPEIWKLTAW